MKNMESSNNYIELSKEMFFKAYLNQMKGEYQEAIRLYKQSLDLNPTVEAYTYLGLVYSYVGELDKAIEECKNAIYLDPDIGNPYNDIGSYLLRQGNTDEAITWFELAINSKKYDNYEYAHVNLGLALERKGLWYEAIDEYNIALEFNKDYIPAKQNVIRLQGMLN
jgi:tetratricopeptide (TPR) repeat protein